MNITEIENTHISRIGGRCSATAGEPFNIAVTVFHEMTKDHYIETIAIGDGEQDYVVVELVPEVTAPRVSLPVRLEKTTVLKVCVCCNKHGRWETSWPVEVTEQTNCQSKEVSF